MALNLDRLEAKARDQLEELGFPDDMTDLTQNVNSNLNHHAAAVWFDILALLRIARAAQAVVAGSEREVLVPPPLLDALRAALEGRE